MSARIAASIGNRLEVLELNPVIVKPGTQAGLSPTPVFCCSESLNHDGSSLIHCQTADAVATLTIPRPHKLNALTNGIMKELAAALDGIATDESIRVVVLTGEGRAFSAGFDVSIDKNMPERTPAGWAEHFRLAYAGLDVFGRCRSQSSPKFVAHAWAAGSP